MEPITWEKIEQELQPLTTPIDEKVAELEEALKKLRQKRNRLVENKIKERVKISKGFPNAKTIMQLDYRIIGNMGGKVMHEIWKKTKDYVESLPGLYSGSTTNIEGIEWAYSPYIMLRKDVPLKQQLGIKKFIPYLPFGKDGFFVFHIFEHTLSAGGSYYLYYFKDGTCKINEGRWNEKIFENLMEALQYIQQNHYYE